MIIIAHLFSGRRRPHDYQSFVEAACMPDNYSQLVLSVDIIFSVRWGNLLRRETRDLFLHAIHQGAIACILAGPPCETWSRARKRGLTVDSGPRPVRSLKELFGLSHLRCSELQQVLVGNDLLGISLVLAYAQWLSGAMFLLEHPGEPTDDPEAPSIWRTTVLKLLESLPGNARRLYMQGYYGSASVNLLTFCLFTDPLMLMVSCSGRDRLLCCRVVVALVLPVTARFTPLSSRNILGLFAERFGTSPKRTFVNVGLFPARLMYLLTSPVSLANLLPSWISQPRRLARISTLFHFFNWLQVPLQAPAYDAERAKKRKHFSVYLLFVKVLPNKPPQCAPETAWKNSFPSRNYQPTQLKNTQVNFWILFLQVRKKHKVYTLM